jgi:hypothetical protein
LSQLEDRERTHPQHRLRLDKLSVQTPELVRLKPQAILSERDTLGRALSKQLGLTYVAAPPEFRGRAVACPPMPSVREYLQIVDVRTAQFTLIAKPPGPALDGRTVRLTRDRERGLLLEIDRGISR